MNILAIDTSSQNATVAVMSDKRLIGEYTVNNGKTHSQIIMPLISDIVKKSGLDINDIDVFACGVGPGSFTGLRIGIATAKALSQACKKKIIGVSSVGAVAKAFEYSNMLVCPIIDARRGDVYNAVFENGVRKTSDRAINIEELLLSLEGKDVLFAGDAVNLYRDLIAEKLKDKAHFAENPDRLIKGAFVALLATERAKNNDYDDIYTLEPVYLRTSQAEREYNNRVKGEY